MSLENFASAGGLGASQGAEKTTVKIYMYIYKNYKRNREKKKSNEVTLCMEDGIHTF